VTRGGPGRTVALLAAIVLVALNLRGILSATAPVLPQVRDDLGLTEVQAGLLTTLPVLCFALFAPPAAALVRRLGVHHAMLLALAGIAVTTALRPLGGTTVLLLGTLLAGVCLTIGNVVVPVTIKRDLPARVGLATGLFTAGMCLGAAATAGLTEPLSGWVGWRGALALWAPLALLAVLVWHPATRGREPAVGTVTDAPTLLVVPARAGVWRQRRAWAVSAFLAVQSCAYMSLTAWLPTLLVDTAGVSLKTGGVAMSVFQLLGISGTLLVPVLVGRFRDQVPVALGVSMIWGTTLAGLLLLPSLWPLWILVGGLSHGSGISLSLSLVPLRAADADVAASLSGMVQFVGYGVGAMAPVIVGAVYGATGSWTVPLSLLLVAILGMAAAGAVAGRDVPITVSGYAPLPRGDAVPR
jgi:CP family cyanate transporter-like MFS transporter